MDKDLESYRSQLASNPGDAEALARLEAALVRSADWAGLIALTAERVDGVDAEERVAEWERVVGALEAHLETLEDGGDSSRLALALGSIWEQRLARPDEAMLRYQRSFQLDPTHTEALAAARATYIRQDKWELVLQLYNLEVQASPAPERQADLYVAMADICAHKLDRPDDAAMCVRQARKLVPDHPGAAPYDSLLDSVQRQRQDRFEALLSAAEGTRDPRKRAALKVEAAGLWFDEVPDDERVERLLQEVLAADPRNDPARILLEQFYEANERWDTLIDFLVAQAEGTARKADRLATYLRLAEIATLSQGPEAAVRWHREVLRLDPSEQASLNFCVDFYSNAERWMDLVSVYEAALRTRHRGGNESAMLTQIAMILWKKVADLGAAEGYFKRIKLNDPRNGLMLQFYAEFYAVREDWKRLLSTLAARQNNEAKLAAKVRVGLEMAEVAETKLKNLEKAIDIWKSILKLDGTHAGARDALRRLFFQTTKWNALLELLKEDLELLPEADVQARTAIYGQIIEIYRDQLNLPVMVINTYNQILQADPTNADALDALQEKYTASARWNDLIGILGRRADAAVADGDADRAVELNRQIAQLWLEKFSNPNQAITYLEAILADRPDDAPAIDQLVDIYRHRKDWKSLYAIYERRLPLLGGAAQVDLQVEMAQIAAARLNEPDAAIDLWRRVLAADPDRANASQALEALYQKTSRWGDLGGLYAERAEASAGDPAQAGWLKKLATIQAEKLDDAEAAATTWHAVLRASPGDFHAESFLRELYRSRRDWDALLSLYGERGDWEGYIRLLSAAADESGDVSIKVDLYRRMANVCLVNLENEAAAVECWERVLEQDPDNLEAARTLVPYYQARESWDRLVAAHEVVLRNGPEDPVALMVEMAQVHDERRRDPGQSYLWYARALQSAPSRPDLLAETRRLADASDSRELLVELLEALVGAVETAEAEVRIRQVLAETCGEHMGRRAEAAAHYERVRALGGDTPSVLSALTNLYKQLGQWDDLLEVYDVQLDRADEPQDQAAIVAQIGELHETVRDDPDAARAAYLRLRELDPDNLDALRGLQRLAERMDDAAGLAEYVRAELALSKDPAATASLRFRLGQLAERDGRLGDAVEAYADVLQEQPDHIGTVQALEGFLDGERGPRAAAILEPYMRAHAEWSSLRRVLELQADGSHDPAFRARALREVAEIREHKLSDAAGAFDTYQRLLLEDRGDGSVRGELERLANELGAWDGLANHYARFALGGDVSFDDPEAAALYSRQLAKIQEERLGQIAAARETLRGVMLEQGDDRGLLDSVDRLTARLEDWPGLVEVCERKLLLADATADRVQMLFRIADLHEEVLDNPDAAADVFRRVLEEDPSNERAVASLERIFRNVGRDQDLADLLESRLDGAQGDQRIALGYQLAQVLAYPLERPAEALERYAEVLELAADHHPTLEAIEQILVAGGEDLESRALRARGCEILAPIYVARGDWQSSIHLLQVRLSDTQDVPSRVDLHARVAALYEDRAGDPGAAFAAYGAAFAEDYGNPTVLAALERLGAEGAQWEALAAVLRSGIDDPDQAALLAPDMRREMLGRIARLYEAQIGDLGSAVSFNQRILDDDPDDLKALASLDRLYTAAGDVAALAEVVERRSMIVMDPTEQAQLGFRLGSIYEDQLDAPQKAVEVFARIRGQVDPTNLAAHVALERLYARLDDQRALVEVLVDHADQVEDEAQKKALLYRAAGVYEEALDQAEQAVNVYRQVTEIDPDDRIALSHLDRLYERLERHIDLLDVLERERALAQDDAERDDFDYRLGKLLWDPVGELPRAVAAFRAVLERSPEHRPARAALEGLLQEPEVRLDVARLLIPIYEAGESWEPLRNTLRGTLPDIMNVDLRVETLERIATIEEAYLDDPRAAFESLAEAFAESEAAPRLEKELERLAEGMGAQAELVDLLARVTSPSPERAIELHLKVAALAEQRLDDIPRAIEEHRAVLLIEPDDRRALTALERLYGRTADHHALVEIVERQAELAETSAERKPLYVRIAQMHEEALDDPDAAVAGWRRLLADDEADRTALDNLERLLGSNERWGELAALLEHRVSTIEVPADRAEVEFRLAGVLEGRLADGHRAVEIYRQILVDVPGHEGTITALAALFADPQGADAAGVDRLVVAEILEPIYRDADDHAALVPVLALRQSALSDDPAAQVDLLREIIRLHEQSLGNAAAAFEAGLELLAIAPDDARNRRELHRLANQTDRHDDLARGLDEASADTVDVDLKVALLMELGGVEEQHRSQDERARDVYREVLGIIPGHPPAVDALRELFARTAAWEDLVQLHLDLAENAVDLDEKKALYFKVCQLLEDVVDDSERAIQTYRRVLEIEPDNAQACKALERFYTNGERWTELADLLREEVEYAQDEADRASLRFRLGELLETRLGDLDGAIEAWFTVLQDGGGAHEPSLEALERLLIELEPEDGRRRRVAQILEPLYAEREQWSDWVAVVSVQLTFEADRWARLETLSRIARVHEQQLDAPAAAFAAYSQAFSEDYGNPDLQAQLDRLAEELGAWQPLVDTYLTGIEGFQDLDAAVGILLKVAHTFDVRLEDAQRAIDCYRRVLLVDEANAPALDALERILAAEGLDQELVKVLGRKADFATDPEVTKTLLYQVSQIWEERLDRPDQAIATYRLVFQDDPADVRAVDALIRLYARTSQWELLVEVQRDKLELVESDAERKKILYGIAQCFEEQLDDPDETIRTWRSVLEMDAVDARASEALERLYAREGRWGELIDLLEQERDQASEPDRVNMLELRIAAVLEQELGQVEQAVEIYGTILERTPRQPLARNALERLLGDEEHRLIASRALEPHYSEEEEPAALARIHELQLLDIVDPGERLTLLKRLASLQYTALQHPRGAFESYARAFQEDPSDPEVVEALHQLADDLKAHGEVATLYRDQVGATLDGEVARDINRRLARIYDGKLQETDLAIQTWQAVMNADPYDAEGLAALDRLFQDKQAWAQLIDVLRRRIEVTDGEGVHDLQFRLGYLLEVVDNDTAGALEQYRNVLYERPGHAYSLEALERLAIHLDHRRDIADVLDPIYRDAGHWDKLAILTEMRIELASDGRERARLWLQSAEIRENELDDEPAAFQSFARAFAAAPDDEDVRSGLIRLAKSLEAWGPLTDTFEANLSRINDLDLKLEDHLRIAHWCETYLDDQQRAVGHFRLAMEIDPTNERALKSLEAIYRAAHAWEDLARIYEAKAAAVFDLDERRRWLHQLGELAAKQLNDVPRAVEAYRGALDIDESDTKALTALETLHAQSQNWPAMLGVLERKAESTYDGAELATVHTRIGGLARTELGDPRRAAEAYEKVLELDPQAPGIVKALREIYTETEAWDRLQEVLVKQLGDAEGEDDRVALLKALGDNAETHLDRLDSAMEYRRQVVSLRPQDRDAAQAAFRLFEKSERWFDLVEAMREHFVAIREEADEPERIRLLVRIASLAEARLGDADLAIETLNEVLEMDPDHVGALTVLAQLHERSGDWAQAAETLERALAQAPPGEDRAVAWRRIGLLYLERLERPEDAERALRTAIEESGDAVAVAALLKLARERGDDATALELVELGLGAATGDARIALLQDVAELRGTTGDAAGRVAALEEASALAPTDLKLTDAVLEAYFDAGRHAEAEPILVRTIEALKAKKRFKDVFKYNFRLGVVAEERGDDEAALGYFTEVFEFDATFVPNLVRLGRLRFRQSDWDQALRAFQTALLHQMKLKPAERVEVFYHLGHIRRELGDTRKAKDMFSRALGLDPKHTPSREALDAL